MTPPIVDTTPEPIYDIAIVGGGINGCGIARDAAGRGWSVYLCERDDLASGTSSASTKLIHGGLRYLEHYEFRLVREALLEREVLWRIAPHIVRPLRFVLPHHAGLRPTWLLRLGLFLYDHIGGRRLLPGTRTLDLTTSAAGAPLEPGRFRRGFAYSDCWVDDARLVVLNAMDAAHRGAVIETRTALTSATRRDGAWTLQVANQRCGATKDVRARVLVNAAGPWVADILTARIRSNAKPDTRLVKGSHIVVPKLFDHGDCYIFQNADGRIVFAIPYEGDFTLIGTTDLDYSGDPADVAITDEEVAYLCAAVSEYFAKQVVPSDVVWTYSGVRSLHDEGGHEAAQAATRDYVLDLDAGGGDAALLSIFGGKITTYRRLAEAALAKLAPHLDDARGAEEAGWTASAPLPGGAFATHELPRVIADLRRDYAFLSASHACRLAAAYGLQAKMLLGTATSYADLGQDFGATLTEAEVTYLRQAEWAETAEDVLWRRSKLGLKLTADQRRTLAAFMSARAR